MIHKITYTGLKGLAKDECIVVETNLDEYKDIIQKEFERGTLDVNHLITISLITLYDTKGYFLIEIRKSG